MLFAARSLVRPRHGPYTRRVALHGIMSLVLQANPANGDVRLEQLFSRFMAPCCWRESLLAHHSPKADDLRAQIRKYVAAGRSDEEIKQRLTTEYTSRILAMPEGAKGEWLQWTPVMAIAVGLVAAGSFLRRSLARRTQTAASTVTAATLPADWEDFDS